MKLVYDAILGRMRAADVSSGGGSGGSGGSGWNGALNVTSSTSATYTLADSDQVVEWAPASDCVLSVGGLPSAGIQKSWEVRLSLASAATLTLGSGLAFVTDADGVADSVTGGAVNVMLVRSIASGAKVYICGTEAVQ